MCSTAETAGKSQLQINHRPGSGQITLHRNKCVSNVSEHMQTFICGCDSKIKYFFLIRNRRKAQQVLMGWIFVLILPKRAQNLVKDSIALIGVFFLELSRSACCPASHSPMQSQWKTFTFWYLLDFRCPIHGIYEQSALLKSSFKIIMMVNSYLQSMQLLLYTMHSE